MNWKPHIDEMTKSDCFFAGLVAGIGIAGCIALALMQYFDKTLN